MSKNPRFFGIYVSGLLYVLRFNFEKVNLFLKITVILKSVILESALLLQYQRSPFINIKLPIILQN